MTVYATTFGAASEHRAFRRSRSPRNFVKSAADWVAEVNRRRRDREALRAMTPDQLEDIGISYADIERMSIFHSRGY